MECNRPTSRSLIAATAVRKEEIQLRRSLVRARSDRAVGWKIRRERRMASSVACRRSAAVWKWKLALEIGARAGEWVRGWDGETEVMRVRVGRDRVCGEKRN